MHTCIRIASQRIFIQQMLVRRDKSKQTKKQLEKNLQAVDIPIEYAELVPESLFPATYPQLIAAIVRRSCPHCHSCVFNELPVPPILSETPVRLWGTTSATDAVPEVSFVPFRKSRRKDVDAKYTKWCRACRWKVNDKEQRRVAAMKAERESTDEARAEAGGLHAVRARTTVGGRRKAISAVKGRKLHWCGLATTSEDNALQLRFDLGLYLFRCSCKLRKRKRNSRDQSRAIFQAVSADIASEQRMKITPEKLRVQACIVAACVNAYAHCVV